MVNPISGTGCGESRPEWGLVAKNGGGKGCYWTCPNGYGDGMYPAGNGEGR